MTHTTKAEAEAILRAAMIRRAGELRAEADRLEKSATQSLEPLEPIELLEPLETLAQIAAKTGADRAVGDFVRVENVERDGEAAIMASKRRPAQ